MVLSHAHPHWIMNLQVGHAEGYIFFFANVTVLEIFPI